MNLTAPLNAVQPSSTERGSARGRARGRGRGCGRRRGRGRDRGRRRASARIRCRTVGRGEDPSHGWRIGGGNEAKLVLEHAFIEEVIGEKGVSVLRIGYAADKR